jgi:hypothetical protein
MIRIYLTPEESQGLRLSGEAPDDEIAGQIIIVLMAGGMEQATAEYLAGRLAQAAIRARNKIEEATRYEIIVTGENMSADD